MVSEAYTISHRYIYISMLSIVIILNNESFYEKKQAVLAVLFLMALFSKSFLGAMSSAVSLPIV